LISLGLLVYCCRHKVIVAGSGDISLCKIKSVAPGGYENVVAEDALGLYAGRRAPHSWA
jgi:hypothetical protein